VQRAAAIHAPPGKNLRADQRFPAVAGCGRPTKTGTPICSAAYSGAASGKGAVYEWNGNKNVGSGRMEILDAPAPARSS